MRGRFTALLMAVVLIFGVSFFAVGVDVIKLETANYLPTTNKMSLLTGKFCDEIK